MLYISLPIPVHYIVLIHLIIMRKARDSLFKNDNSQDIFVSIISHIYTHICMYIFNSH